MAAKVLGNGGLSRRRWEEDLTSFIEFRCDVSDDKYDPAE